MPRKFLTVGLVFILAGVSTLLWLTRQESKWQQLRDRCRAKYAAGSKNFLDDWLELPDDLRTSLSQQKDDGTSRTIEEIKQEQYERFVADFDKLGSIEPRLYPVARILYGDDWQERLSEYNRQQKLRDTFFAGSVICCCVGGALVLSSLVAMGIVRLHKTRPHKHPVRAETEQDEITDAAEEEQKTQKPKLAAILNCHKYGNEGPDKPLNIDGEQPASNSDSGKKSGKGPDSTKHLYTDRESVEPGKHQRRTSIKLAELISGKQKDADSSSYVDKSFFSSYKSIKQAKSDIDRGAKKFSKDAKMARQIGEKQPNLLNETLNKLTEEVAAIRSYAGQQEERVKKFQEGYDWNIIRSFALRVIRCIDNLEKKINILAQAGRPTDHLQEIKDELLFALESAGLERFEPQVNSDYRGQEKTTEAVREKASADKDELKGKIADVVRCGYRFMVDQDNFKVVRAAQVRVFG
jgi:molecular chaperone GrpE (heat shock protein)